MDASVEIITTNIENKVKNLLMDNKIKEAKSLLNNQDNAFEKSKWLYLNACIENASNNVEESITFILDALKIDTHNPIFLKFIGMLYGKMESWELAIEYLTQLLHVSPYDIEGHKSLAYAQAKTDDKKSLHITLLRMCALTDLNEISLDTLVSLCDEYQIKKFSPILEKGLLKLVSNNKINHQSLASTICSYLVFKYHLNDDSHTIILTDLSCDKICIQALVKIRLSSFIVEQLLINVRACLLTHVYNNNQINNNIIQLLKSIAIQNYLNEYVSLPSKNELDCIKKLEISLDIRIKKSNFSVTESQIILLTLSMYKTLYSLRCANKLLAITLDKWPESLDIIVNKTLIDIEHEKINAQETLSILPITDDVSKNVQRHYEQNPYPRWTTIKPAKIDTISNIIEQFCPKWKNKIHADIYTLSPNILVAGCGTGIEPISIALQLPNAHITAVDLSRKSLSYAKTKAKEHGVNNITFLHGDILSLPLYFKHASFSYIVSCGVLHHTENPKKSWQCLTTLLKPKGVMKIALYSQSARSEIKKERDIISERKLEATKQSIQKYRHEMLTRKNRSHIVYDFIDFYSLSECRDLLFHQHEICFNWSMIAEHCDALSLDFMGLIDRPNIIEKYAQRFNDQKDTDNIKNLAILEEENPYLFKCMYNFLVYKPLK